MNLIKRVWILLTIVALVAVAGFVVYRLHGIFGAHRQTTVVSARADDVKPFNPKHVTLEVFGPAGSQADTNEPGLAPSGKRERLIAAACELLYRRGIARTTLADIAAAAEIPLGNMYYYFKTKDDIVGAVVEARTEELRSATAPLGRRYSSPKARLKALVAMLADARDTIADHGCPYGTLCTEVANHSGGSSWLTAPLMQILLDWTEQQFDAMGRRDAHDLALELVTAYPGSAVLTNALGQPDLMARQARRIEKWINALQVETRLR